MNWIFIAYGAFLCYLLVDRKRVINESSFHTAWMLYVAIPFSNAFLTLFRAGNIESLISVQIWADGFASLLFGISFFVLFSALTEELELEKPQSDEANSISDDNPPLYIPNIDEHM